MTISVIADPGFGWLAVAAGGSVLVIEARASDRLDELQTALRSDDATRSVLALLVASGLDELPSFALVSFPAGSGTARVVLRGPVTVSSGSDTISGNDVETWTERSIAAADAVRISTPAEGRLPALPLRDGVVWAAEVVLEAASAELLPGADKPAVAAPAVAAPAPAVPAAVPHAQPSPQIVEHTIAEPQDDVLGYDHLFEATVVRSVEEAAVRPDAPVEPETAPVPVGQTPVGQAPVSQTSVSQTPSVREPVIAAPAGVDPASDDDDDGDHDGLTVFSDRLGEVKGRVRPHPSEIAEADAAASFWVRMPSGAREPLTGEVLVGRAPTTRVGDGPVPRLVTLPNDPDISRTHVKFALEGDTVVVTDLHSRNGTIVVLPGKSPQVLRAGESATVIADTVVDLGGGTTMTVEQDPS